MASCILILVFFQQIPIVALVESRSATGAVKGVLGLFSYLGAATQDWISGYLIHAGRTVVEGKESYNFDYAFYFWIGASVLSCILAATVWNVKVQE